MQFARLTTTAAACAAALMLAVGCAAPAGSADTQQTRRASDDAPTGSHLPRKDKDRASGVKQVSPEELEKAQEYRVRSQTSR
jgi:hypothetical protein